MATLHFGVITTWNGLRFSFGDAQASPPYSMFVTTTGIGQKLRILKGTVPTDFSTLTSTTSRSSDTLVEFSRAWNITDEFIQNLPTNSTTFTLNTIPKTATASGTATWFWWFAHDTYSTTIYNQGILGTVGLLSSGADLEIPNVNIVSGYPYKISNIIFYVPASLSY